MQGATVPASESGQNAPPAGALEACSLLTKAEVSAAAGSTATATAPGTPLNAGPNRLQSSSCQFKNDAGMPLVDVAWSKGAGAKGIFDSLRQLAGSAAQDVPGLGDSAYYANFAVTTLKGDNVVIVSLFSIATKPSSDAVVPLAKAAVPRVK